MGCRERKILGGNHMEDKYINTIDIFMREHPEIDPSLKSIVEPIFRDSEDQLYNFIMCYIFM